MKYELFNLDTEKVTRCFVTENSKNALQIADSLVRKLHNDAKEFKMEHPLNSNSPNIAEIRVFAEQASTMHTARYLVRKVKK